MRSGAWRCASGNSRTLPAGGATTERARRERGSPDGPPGRGLGGEVCAETEVVACPDSVYRLVEDALASLYVQCGPVGAAAHEDVVDPTPRLQLPVPVLRRHQRVLGGEAVAGLPGVGASPGVAVADAQAAQGLQTAPKAHACRLWGGVEVAGQDHVPEDGAILGDLLHEPPDDNRLQLALVLVGELPVG